MSRLGKIITIDSLLFGLAVGVASAVGMFLYKKYKKRPKGWEAVGTVQNLYIYPLKSGRRIELKKAICTDYGVQTTKEKNRFQLRDRTFVVYAEETNQFRTARDHPKLVNVVLTAYDETNILLDALYEPKLKVKIPDTKTSQKVMVKLHKKEEVPMMDCGDEAAEWISICILQNMTGLRLGYYDCSERRNLHNTHQGLLSVYNNLRNKATGMYSDLTSYLIMNRASVDHLNAKIETEEVTANNFRPNILVESTSGLPYDEDDWEFVKINDVVFYYVKPCTRCILTTVNPITAVKSENNEPLKTLREYRQLKDIKSIEFEGSLPVMGVNMGLQNGGEISVGDTVYVRRF